MNVDFDVYRIRTKISERGSTVEAGLVTTFRERETRRVRLEKLDEDVVYDANRGGRKRRVKGDSKPRHLRRFLSHPSVIIAV